MNKLIQKRDFNDDDLHYTQIAQTTDYPYMVREWKNDKMIAIAHNLYDLEAKEALKSNIDNRDFRHQTREHLAEDADRCPECAKEIVQEEEDEDIPGAFGTHQIHDIG